MIGERLVDVLNSACVEKGLVGSFWKFEPHLAYERDGWKGGARVPGSEVKLSGG